MNWAVVLLLVFWIVSTGRFGKRQVLGWAVGAMVLFAVAFIKLDRWLTVTAKGTFGRQLYAAGELARGQWDRNEIIHYVNPDVATVQRGLRTLEARHLSIYYRAR